MTNIALVGANFALKGYIPAIKKIKNLILKFYVSRSQKKKNDFKIEIIGKNILDKIDLILAVPPKIQFKILKHNLYYKKYYH